MRAVKDGLAAPWRRRCGIGKEALGGHRAQSRGNRQFHKEVGKRTFIIRSMGCKSIQQESHADPHKHP